MRSIRAIAKDDYNMTPHTWQKGLDYEIVFKGDYIAVASDQGQVNFTGIAMEGTLKLFEINEPT